MCPGKFNNKINVINFFVLNKSNDIDFVTFFLLIQLHYQMELVMRLISISFQFLKRHNTSLDTGDGNSLLNAASSFQSTFLSSKGDLLKPAKLHHLNSFVSRNSKDSPPDSAGSVSSSIYSSMFSMAREANPVGANSPREHASVGFNLNETNMSDLESQYMSANVSPVPGEQPEPINRETTERLKELSDSQQ